MSIQAYTHDEKRSIEAKPVEAINGLVVLAKVYDSAGVYKGIANAVKPDPEEASSVLNITNSGAGTENVTVVVSTKMRYEDTYTELESTILNVAVGTADYTVLYDSEDKDDIKVAISAVGANCVVNSIEVEKAPFTSLVGLAVGGDANEPVVIPCDFRGFEPGEYSVVFVAEGYGVIGRDIMILFGPDGFSDG